eukprot:364516-Chlamydomonas_euryale.AAC.7
MQSIISGHCNLYRSRFSRYKVGSADTKWAGTATWILPLGLSLNLHLHETETDTGVEVGPDFRLSLTAGLVAGLRRPRGCGADRFGGAGCAAGGARQWCDHIKGAGLLQEAQGRGAAAQARYLNNVRHALLLLHGACRALCPERLHHTYMHIYRGGKASLVCSGASTGKRV